MFEYKPDFEQVLDRMEEWWSGESDRALAAFSVPRPPEERIPYPEKEHASFRDMWWDTDYQVRRAEARAANQIWMGADLPVVWPNLGPEVFAAFYGCELDYTERTSWSVPNLEDWSDEAVDKIRFDMESPYLKKIDEMTTALLEVARGRFIVGHTDLHPGGDALASFRDPQMLCMDMLTEREAVRRLLGRVTKDFLKVYDHFNDRLAAEGMPASNWLNLTCRGKYHVPSNDFSCMVSEADFQEVFLPGIVEECRHMDRCIYHLDGPDALRHLDALLDVPEIHAIQWVYGTGNEPWSRWIDVYRRVQARGKGFFVSGVNIKDLDAAFEAFGPRGAYLRVEGVATEEEGREVLRRVERWGR